MRQVLLGSVSEATCGGLVFTDTADSLRCSARLQTRRVPFAPRGGRPAPAGSKRLAHSHDVGVLPRAVTPGRVSADTGSSVRPAGLAGLLGRPLFSEGSGRSPGVASAGGTVYVSIHITS